MIQKSNKPESKAGSDPSKTQNKKGPIRKLATQNSSQNGLQIDEGEFKQLLEAVPDGLVIVNTQGKIQFVNKQIEGMFGYLPEEILGKPVEFLIPERFSEHVENREAYFSNLYARPMGNGLTLFAVRKDKTEFQVEISLSPLSLKEKTYIIAAIRDVSLQKQAEKQLEQSQERYHQILDNMLVGCQIIDFDWRYIYANAVAAGQGHRKPDELLMRTMMDAYPGIENTELFMVLKNCMEERIPKHMENRFDHPDGSIGWFELSVQPAPEGIFILSIDITERKQAEAALLESGAQFRTLFEASPDAIVLINPQNNWIILDCNTAACQMNGYTREELIGQSIDILNQDPALAPERAEYLEQIRQVSILHTDVLHRRKDGSIFPVEISTSLIMLGGHEIVLGIDRDITERKRADELLVKSEQHYRTLFEDSPISLWEEDFSAVKLRIEQLRQQGITDFQSYFSSHPDVVIECAGLVRVLDVNKVALKLYQSKSKADLLSGLVKVFGPELLTHFQGELICVAEGQNEYNWEGQERTLTGEGLDVRMTWVVAPGHEKNLSKVIVSIVDITERKQVEQALRQSDERFRSLFENTPVAIWEEDFSQVKIYLDSLKNVYGTDLETYFGDHPDSISICANLVKIIDVNQASLELHEARDKKELLDNLTKTFTPESYLAFQKELVAIGKGERYLQMDEVVQTLDGQRRDVSINWAVVPGYEENFSRVLVSLIDITERKLAEEEIQTRTDELQTLYELSRDLADANDLDEILNLVNRHAVESVHTTFARVLLLDGDNFVMRAAYPVRFMDHDLMIGRRIPAVVLPYCKSIMVQNKAAILRNNSMEVGSAERTALLLDFAQSLCLIPMWVGSSGPGSRQALGLLILGEARSESREPFTPGKMRLSESIGDQAASAIRRMLLYEQTERRLKHLSALREIDQVVASSFGLELSLRTVLTQVTEQLSVDAAVVWLFNSASNLLEYSASRGFRTKAFGQAHPLRLGEGYAGKAALERHVIHIPNLTELNDNPRLLRALEKEPFISYYSVPLMAKGSIKGVLEVFHRLPLEADDEWLDFLYTLAGQAAIAIDNATLFENLQRSNADLIQAYDTTLEGWSAALDLRDKETEGHTQRVTVLTVKLAESMGFNQSELVQVRRGALLHDIGKMGVPDRILLKPDKLTDEEWVIMRMHPTYAYQMLKPIAYLRPALDIPHGHHEKWDGTGYPRGLKGENIPLAARIFAAVDIYDALTSDRPYRKSWAHEKTLDYIRELSGTHLDPQVVAAFLKMIGKNE